MEAKKTQAEELAEMMEKEMAERKKALYRQRV